MFTIVDAVMGTGKSTVIIEGLNKALKVKYIILVPSLPEATRYKEGLSSEFEGKRNDIVALDADGGPKKTPLFIEAVQDSKTVVITHELFSRLSQRDFDHLSNLNCKQRSKIQPKSSF